MPYYCTVPRCTSMAGKAKNVSFHQFPRDQELAKLWNRILKRGKPYTKYSKVCSLHFTPDDYTITSVGKNKGQWRTLRKDAIPSQNLPSESPTPYQRKQWGSWSQDSANGGLDPAIQQQMAQAIYMQTMLAMQSAGQMPAEIPSTDNGTPPPQNDAPSPHTSKDPLNTKETNSHDKNTSQKCPDCSKCFKDPDVFLLHKRGHLKHEKNEKENFNLNLTLQANPILANLLNTNNENAMFDSASIMEKLLVTAFAANMEGYMNLLKLKNEANVESDSNFDMADSNERDESYCESESNGGSESNFERVESNGDSELNFERHDKNNESESNGSESNFERAESNFNRDESDIQSKPNFDSCESNDSEESNENDPKNKNLQNDTNFQNDNSPQTHFSSNSREISKRFQKNQSNDASERTVRYIENDIDFDDVISTSVINSKSTRICDVDMNESVESNRLVIDETV